MKKNIRDLTYTALEEQLQEMGEPRFRVKQVFPWIYKEIDSFDEMRNIPQSLRGKLAEKFVLHNIKIKEKYISKIDETRRYLLQLGDGNFVESVLMKYKHGYSICISSQVGCAMGCAFCASTRCGKVRNLSAGEIIDQVAAVQRDLGCRINNIVMMGIGEPLDNFENVMVFLENVNHPLGLAVGHRHITLSTCGIVPKILELAEKELQITLSVSLHACSNEKRSAIMPVNRKYPIEELLEACRYYIGKTNRRISFEYTLIQGVNDSEQEAEKLLRLVRGMLCHVNLIPVNPVKETGFAAGSRAGIERFQHVLTEGGISATIRREMGRDISAACGQLRSQRLEV